MPTPHRVKESVKKATEGFADAVPSPMAVAPTKKADIISPSKQTVTTKPSGASSTVQSPVEKVQQAKKASNNLIQSALLSSLEASYTALQAERDALQTQLSSTSATVDRLKLENTSLKSASEENSKSIEARGKSWRGELEGERNRRNELEKKLKWSEERVDRLEGEGESLRGEISRLTKTNEQHTNLITQIQTQNSFSTSQVIPLKLEITRLQQELDAVTSHSNHIEEQLSTKSHALAEARNELTKEIRLLKTQSEEKQWELEKRDREISSTRRHFELAQSEIERMRNAIHEKECHFIEQREMMEQDLNKERELVSLKEQAMQLARDQRDAAVEELKDIRALAQEAAQRESRLETEMESKLRSEVENAVRLIKEEEEGKRVVLVDRVRMAEDEKKRLEEDVLNKRTPSKRRRMIEEGHAPLSITDGLDGERLGITDLYSRLAEAEDDLRAEQHENKKLKIIIDRIHRDVASKTPIFQQKQLELENALEELDVLKDRLDYARTECTDIRADNQDLELRNQQMERESRELKRENKDLALQVQRLLQRGASQGIDDSVTFDSIQTLQEQNQKLLRGHHTMSAKIADLEGHINNNPEKIALEKLKEEVVNLREEREKQSKLVAGIIHQRDLYRALVAKNDATFVESDAGNALAIADAKAEELPLLEAKNRELVNESSKLRADLSSFKYEKESLEGRLARVDAHAEELTSSNDRMRGELTAATSTMARLEADVSQYRGRCERLEASLDAMKDEKESEANRRSRMEELNSKLQTHLDGARSTLAKHQQQFESAASKVKMLEVQLENAKASESRMTAEANDLRAEISRQGSLLGSVQRIEASLAAQSESERGHLENEIQRLRERLSNDEEKHSETVKRLGDKMLDLELTVKDLTTQKEAATENAFKANNEVSQSKVKIQEITLKLKSAEKELGAAKRKLGAATIDTSVEEALEAKVASLTSELEATKSDLEKSKDRINNYQGIAKSAEEQLAEITAASSKYKKETEASLKRLQQSEQSQKEAVTELTKDLMEHRNDKEKAVNELQSKIESLNMQLNSAKKDASEAIARMESLNSEMKSYQLNASNATNNYERELALHAEARTALRDARSKAESEQSLKETAEAALDSRRIEFESKESTWQAEKAKLEESTQQAKKRYEELQQQNHLLHERMATLSENVEKFQTDRTTAQLVGDKDSVESTNKELNDLRELLQFKQSECVMLLADLASSKRTAERERTAAEMAKKSLEEARSEMKMYHDSSKEIDSAAADKNAANLRNELKTAQDQLELLRESNTMLREETQRLTKKLSIIEAECKEMRTAASPNNSRICDLEVQKAALEGEKVSLSKEIDAWKNRVHNLVSKFNQIDPEEHAQALASIEKMKAEAMTLKSQKEQADKDSSNAKSLISRLNKEVSSQKSSMEAFKKALERSKQENEKLSKSLTTNKKIAEAQAAVKKSEEALKTKTAELESANQRVDNLKALLGKLKAQNDDFKDAEGKTNANIIALQTQIDSLKNKLSQVGQTTESSNPPTMQDATQDITPADEKVGEAQVEAVEAEKTAVEKLGTSTPATEDQPNPNAVQAVTATADSSDKPVPTMATNTSKKKGKKRKGTPKKNDGTVGNTAPPLKKPATAIKASSAQTEDVDAAGVPPASADNKVALLEKEDSTDKQAVPVELSKPTQDEDALLILATAAETNSTAQQKITPAKKMIKLTKTNKDDTPKITQIATKVGESETNEMPSTATEAKSTQQKTIAPPKKMIKLKKTSKDGAPKTTQIAASQVGELETKEMPATATEAKQSTQQKAIAPPKKMIKLNKTSQDGAPKATQIAASQVEESEIKEVPATATEAKPTTQQKSVTPPKKMIKLTKTSQMKKDDASHESSASNAGKNEEEMKKKMLLLKKRKAEVQLMMQAAAKKKGTAPTTPGQSLDESDTSSGTDKPATAAVSLPNLDSSAPQKSLPTVPEKGESMAEQEDIKEQAKAELPPAPVTFGSSTTVAGFGVPASKPLQSEPTCPKPSFFGSSSVTPTSAFGSGSSAPAFGSGPTPAIGSSSSDVIVGAEKPDENPESPDVSVTHTSSGAFLNLAPPGKSDKPSQFVFGKSANITLPVPAPSPFGVFNQKTQATPFGAAFNINPPFGAGVNEPASEPAEKSADADTDKMVEETVEDDEVKEDTSQNDGTE